MTYQFKHQINDSSLHCSFSLIERYLINKLFNTIVMFTLIQFLVKIYNDVHACIFKTTGHLWRNIHPSSHSVDRLNIHGKFLDGYPLMIKL